MTLKSAPAKRSRASFERWLEGLSKEDRATVMEYMENIADYSTEELLRFFKANGYEGGRTAISDRRRVYYHA